MAYPGNPAEEGMAAARAENLAREMEGWPFRPTARSVRTQLGALATDIEIISNDSGPSYVTAQVRFSEQGKPVTLRLSLFEALQADIIERVR